MIKKDDERLTYASVGVDYSHLDPFKQLAQTVAASTSENLARFGMYEITASRGESAYIWKEADVYRAFVMEGLGTKNRIADEMRHITNRTYYDSIAQDTVAMIVNDLVVVGAEPQVVTMYAAVGRSDWFADHTRMTDLVTGYAQAINTSGATWGGGETPALKDIIEPYTIDLAGSAIGIIQPERLTLGDKLVDGDAIFLVESSGIHANGITLARELATRLPQGYATKLSDGCMYGEALLTPTHIYAGLIRDLFDAGIDIHYMTNITGHGWRKLMRANQEFSYIIDHVPPPTPVFDFIQKLSGSSERDMYGTFNMGAGFAIFLPDHDVQKARNIAMKRYGWQSGKAGHIETGPKQVAILPHNVTFTKESLMIR